jgi:4,5-DOPA dioxygenase extradiol
VSAAPKRSLFLSHGAPDQLLRDDATTRFWRALGAELGRPRAFLVATAHWTTREVAVEVGGAPRTLHDFGGFASELHELRYPAPGESALAEEALRLLRAAGLGAIGVERGFDHGVWVPLSVLRPAADVPVIALSVQPQRDAAHHVAVGRALKPLLETGCVLLGSGGATHALGELAPRGGELVAWAAAFEGWLTATLEQGDLEAGLAWELHAPHARRNHPSVEHLLPLFVAWGAGGAGARGRMLHAASDFGVLSLSAFDFAIESEAERTD